MFLYKKNSDTKKLDLSVHKLVYNGKYMTTKQGEDYFNTQITLSEEDEVTIDFDRYLRYYILDRLRFEEKKVLIEYILHKHYILKKELMIGIGICFFLLYH